MAAILFRGRWVKLNTTESQWRFLLNLGKFWSKTDVWLDIESSPPPLNFAEAACFVDDLPIQELNTPSGGWLNVFMDLTFECTTTVIGWEFHATKAGTFYAGIWRLADGDESQMTLIATNKVTAEEEGKQVGTIGSRYYTAQYNTIVDSRYIAVQNKTVSDDALHKRKENVGQISKS